MTTTYRFRLVVLATALLLVAGITLWTIQQSWTRITLLERRLTGSQIESFRLATQFSDRLRTLNNLVLRFVAGRDPEAPKTFEKASADLNKWIDEHDPKLHTNSVLTTDTEKQIVPLLNQAYDEYLAASSEVFAKSKTTTLAPALSAELDRFEQQSQKLFSLGDHLAEAHRQAQDVFLSTANHELAVLRLLMMAAIITMMALVVILGAVLYRDLVKPLRVRLVQSEAVLERQEKLATLGTLAAGIAHEIRNPLTSIKARLYTLAKHIKGNDAGQTDAKTIGEEIARLERIVQEVLSFARPSEPRKVVTPADTPLREVHSLMASTLEQGGARLQLESAGGLYIAIDAALIKQVLINLVRNAAEALTGPGTVTLRCRAARANLHETDCAVAVLEVADTGKGIPPEIEPRLFDPFFTTKEAGTGLGLAIAARIVEKHGGMLQYQTRPGHGTTFGVVLPTVKNPPSPGKSEATDSRH